MNHKLALIIFIKNPILGKAKTRIAKTVGDQKALEIYKELLNYTQKVADKVNKIEKYLFYTYFVNKSDNWNNETYNKQRQVQKGNLGNKMKEAFEFCFNNKAEKVVIIGSDCGDLTTQHIHQAFEALDTNEVVFGPAKDGGYYLLGMKQKHYFIFENKQWSTPNLLQTTLTEIAEKKLSYHLLETLNDIDFYEDYVAWKNAI